jgi:dTDP-4-amino-4,6-dideoxygalactose transaminase
MGKLAITGGGPLRSAPLPNWPVHDEREVQALTRVAYSGRWLMGREVAEFEQAFAENQHARHGICVTNGTTTMAIGLKALGVAPGHEILLPALSHFVTLAALICKAIPVYVDVDPNSYNFDPKNVEQAITPRTKAIILIHYSGTPADMDGVMEVANKHHLGVIEDSAHAHGSEWKGTRVGAIGHLGSFSFQADKVMVSGDGGIITTNDDALAAACRSYRNFGMAPNVCGGNYRMTEFQAAVLKVQLSRLDDQIAQRKENLDLLDARLAQIDGIKPLPFDPRITRHSGYGRVLRYDFERFGVPVKTVIRAIYREGLPVAQVWPPAQRHWIFDEDKFGMKGCPFSCHQRDINYREQVFPVAERAFDQEGIYVPRTIMVGGKREMNDLADAIAKVMENIDELRDLPVD